MSNIDKEIEKIVEEKMKLIGDGDSRQVDILWQYMNEINERLKCIELQKEDKQMSKIDEQMIDEYLSEGYDRQRDDEVTEIEDENPNTFIDDELEEPPMTCSRCGNVFEFDELDIIDGEWVCWDCENKILEGYTK